MKSNAEQQRDFHESVSRSIGRERAIEMCESGWWEGLEPKKAALIILTTRELCAPFRVFHRLLEEALGRPVFTHELALNYEGIYLELIGEADPPSLEEILNLIPAEKRVIVIADNCEDELNERR